MCRGVFPVGSFTTLRYLDAAGSGLTLEDVKNNTYLIWLRLASCGLRSVPRMELPNLLTLDLSGNELTSLSMHVFATLINLRQLDLSHNPLRALSDGRGNRTQSQLSALDLALTFLTTFSSAALRSFPGLRLLNVSFSQIDKISEEGLTFTRDLAVVDLLGNPVTTFPTDIFHPLHQLQAVTSDNYKLCCRASLPSHFDQSACAAPRDELSSCEDLLRTDAYRVALYVFTVMAIVGNVGCLLFRLLQQRSAFLTGFNLFVSSLGVADLLMGVYLAVVGAADHAYRGRYFSKEVTWRSSVACQVAGFLSLLSCEVSAAMVCGITLDRLLTLRFPFSRLRFTRRSASLTCVALWGLGLVLAALPLLPGTSHWQFYQNTGICIPLPVTRRRYGGQYYAFGVMIVLNLLFFLLVASGQLLIYHTVRQSAHALRDVSGTSSSKNPEVRVARRLTSIVVTDFLCWFPLGLLGVLAACGVPISGEVSVALAIFVLPLNSALNPFLYTFNALRERWERLEERRLLRQLQARMREANLPSKPTSDSVSEATVDTSVGAMP
jgi:hypothetical protein